VPGPRVHHQAGGFVHHGHRGVGVDHGELDAGFRLDARRSRLGQGDGEDGAVVQGSATDRHHRAVDQHPAAGDQPGGHGARDVGQHGHGPVNPHPGQERRHLDDEWAFGLAHALEPAGCPKNSDATRTTTPTVMQASATLKVGQWLSVMKSATSP